MTTTQDSAVIPLALYIHVPWCVRKCPYCDFNSHTLRQPLPEAAYVQALLQDLALDLQAVPSRSLRSIFFGGGTPSLLTPAAVAELLAGIQARIPFDHDIEITLEANPGTVDKARFAGFRAAGINRLSLGIQSFDDAALARLGRIHGRDEALAAITAATQAGFDNFNIDLMFGLPGQDLNAALDDLQIATALQAPHLSWYQLTLEPNTLFYRHPPDLPDDDLVWEMQQAGQALISQHGYTHYEISAYGQSGRFCQHNLNYWQFGDYLGIGAGAHGKLTQPGKPHQIQRQARHKHPQTYLNATPVERIASLVTLKKSELILEFMLNALRLLGGFSETLLQARTGLLPIDYAAPVQTAIAQGWLHQAADWMQPTAEGVRCLNDLLLLFMPEETDKT